MAQTFTNSIASTKQFEPVKFGLPAAILGIDPAENTVLRCRLAPAVTLAQLNAGFVLIPPDASKTIIVVDVLVVTTGIFAGLTDIRISDTAASPIDIITIAQAQATNGARFTDAGGTGVTFGAGGY